jgi:arylsulfatase A-like enzyme
MRMSVYSHFSNYHISLFIFIILASLSGPLKAQQAPNILLIIADDMGLDASPCHKDVAKYKPHMPTLENLCDKGVRFDNVWAAPMCSPTRAAILTGRHGFRTGVIAPTGRSCGVIPLKEKTLFIHLARRVYSQR